MRNDNVSQGTRASSSPQTQQITLWGFFCNTTPTLVGSESTSIRWRTGRWRIRCVAKWLDTLRDPTKIKDRNPQNKDIEHILWYVHIYLLCVSLSPCEFGTNSAFWHSVVSQNVARYRFGSQNVFLQILFHWSRGRCTVQSPCPFFEWNVLHGESQVRFSRVAIIDTSPFPTGPADNLSCFVPVNQLINQSDMNAVGMSLCVHID